MSKGYTVAPWRPKPGTGQSLAVANGSSATFTNAVGLDGQTRAILISLAPQTTAAGALVKITQTGAAATATDEVFVKTTDPPLLLAVSPGDKVSVYGTAVGTAYLVELTQ